MSKKEARLKALELAREKLHGVDMAQRGARLGFVPDGSSLNGRAFKHAIRISQELEIATLDDAQPLPPGDVLLILHALQCERNLDESEAWHPYRAFAGGAFYLGPFRSRTVEPLQSVIGNDIELLRQRLDRHVDWTPVDRGDLGARIHGFGKLYLLLVYNKADEEFPAAAEICFNQAARQCLNTEDAAVLASRICLGLLR